MLAKVIPHTWRSSRGVSAFITDLRKAGVSPASATKLAKKFWVLSRPEIVGTLRSKRNGTRVYEMPISSRAGRVFVKVTGSGKGGTARVMSSPAALHRAKKVKGK